MSPFPARIEKDVNLSGTTTVSRFAYDGQNSWADLSSTNTLQARHLYLGTVDSIFARITCWANISIFLSFGRRPPDNFAHRRGRNIGQKLVCIKSS